MLMKESVQMLLLDWKAQVGFEDGLKRTIAWYEEHRDAVVSGGGRA